MQERESVEICAGSFCFEQKGGRGRAQSRGGEARMRLELKKVTEVKL